MSKFVVRGLVLGAIALFSVSISPAQTKVGVINIQKAIIETAEIKKAQATLETKYKPRQVELEKIQKELADIEAQIQNPKTTQQAAQEMQARGQRRQREAQRMTEDLQGDVDRERNEVLQNAGSRMIEVIKKIAEAKGLDVVVDAANTHFFKPGLEITSEAVAAFDKAYPAK